MNMKDKKSTRKRLFAVIIIMVAALLIIPLCAFTANGGEGSHDMETEDISIATSSNANAPDDEPQADGNSEDIPYISVSSYEELIAAIEQAEAETVIDIDCLIECPDDTALGNPNRSVIFRRTSPDGRFVFNGNQGFIQNITFDGNNIFSFFPFISSGFSSLTMENCNLINCNGTNGAAIRIASGKASLIGCLFDNNTGDSGAHLCVDGGWATIENCTFTNGYAKQRGGAIFNSAGDGISLSGCVITGNSAELCGGGIYNSVKTLSITQSKIHGNMAGSEMDDIALSPVSHAPEFDDYQDVIKLYEPDGLFPNDWETREYFEDMMPDPVTVYFRTFGERNPEPEPPSLSITLNKPELILNIGDSDTLIATLQPEGTGGNIEWNSSDSTVASVDDTGLVTAVSAGKTSITAAAGDASATCLVTVLPNMYTIDVEPNPAHGGNVSGGGDYEDGASVTITASPKAGFRFLEWIENGSQVSTDANYTFTANSSRKLTAIFELVPIPTYSVNVTSTAGGTVEGGGQYKQGESVTVTAISDNGYRFISWQENGITVSDTPDFSFTADADRTLTAVFEPVLPPEQAGNPESGPNGDESGSNGDNPGPNSGESGSNSGEPGSNGDEFAANVKTDVPCSVTALIVFYDENGQMISAVSHD